MDFPLARARIFWFIDKTAQPPHTHSPVLLIKKKKSQSQNKSLHMYLDR